MMMTRILMLRTNRRNKYSKQLVSLLDSSAKTAKILMLVVMMVIMMMTMLMLMVRLNLKRYV